ncbi:phosphotransferase, partial [Actinotalea ferrariae]|uniref:phosphotransferase n=1 Tax=Actinotalea ferrariae TaxID=1386098 RepID=UPI001C8B7EE0
HASAAAVAVPARAAEIARLRDALAEVLARTDAGPVVATHGDLHEANLLVDDGALVGLLDVDALGPGHRVDDLACLLAHLSVLPALAPGTYRHVPGALRRWLAAVDDAGAALDVDPVALRARAGAVVLSLVAGSTGGGPEAEDGASRRLDVAGTWLAEARLRDLSSPRPRPLTNGDEAQTTITQDTTTQGTTTQDTIQEDT